MRERLFHRKKYFLRMKLLSSLHNKASAVRQLIQIPAELSECISCTPITLDGAAIYVMPVMQ